MSVTGFVSVLEAIGPPSTAAPKLGVCYARALRSEVDIFGVALSQRVGAGIHGVAWDAVSRRSADGAVGLT